MKRSVALAAAIVAVLLVAAFVFPLGIFGPTGRFYHKRIVESLNSPVRIVEVKETGLITADRRNLLPPLVARIPLRPSVTRDILSYGVEVNADGTTFGLIQVHHWCGNDPVRYHLARVDLSSLFLVLENESHLLPSEIGIDPMALTMAKIPHAEISSLYEEQKAKGSATNGAPVDATNPFL